MNATSITLLGGIQLSYSYDKEAVADYIAGQVKQLTLFLLNFVENFVDSSQQKTGRITASAVEEVRSLSVAFKGYVSTKSQVLLISPVMTRLNNGQAFIALKYNRFKKHLLMTDASTS